MKRSLLVLITAAVAVAVAAVVAVAGSPSAAHGGVAAPGTVTVVGHGVVTLVPDQATISAGVETQATTAAAALGRNAKLAAAVVAALQQGGGKNIQTQQVSLYPRTADDGSIVGYVADDSVSATVGIADSGPLIDAAVAAGATSISGPSLAVSDQDAAYRQALQKAFADARAKADALGQAGGFAIGSVASAVEQSASPPPIVEPMAAAAGKVDSTPVEPGTEDTTADVTVTFRVR
jgi:uncharacterized protein YggE